MKPSFSRVIPKGSVLVFSLIILSVMLVTALTLLSSAVFQEKSALSTGDSAHSFQVADSGVEQVLYQLYQKSQDSITTVAAGLGLSCSDGTVANANAGWTVRFYDVNGNRLTDCASKSEDVASIKSEGTSQGTTRAVQVAVAASGYWSKTSDGTNAIYNINGGYVGIGGTNGDSFTVLSDTSGHGGDGDLHVSGGSDHSWGLYASGETNAAHSIMGVGNLDSWNNMTISFGRDVKIGGNLTCTGATCGSSDIRLKQDVRKISNPLAKVLKLNGVEFEWNRSEFPDRNFPEGDQIGVIAQDVSRVVPEVVSTDDQGYEKVDYPKLNALLIEAIKEQQHQIDGLKARVSELENR